MDHVAARRWLTIVACLLMLAVPFHGVSAQTAAEPTPDPAQSVPNDPTAPQPSDDGAVTGEATTEAAPQEETATESSPVPTSEPADDGNQPSASQSATRADPAISTGFPAVLAHGLTYESGDEVVWQVREQMIPEDAEAEVSNAAIMLQRDGSTVIRNDVTGKRSKIDPGEAYFKSGGDPYTAMAVGADSLVWTFELVDQGEVARDAFYESPVIDTIDEGVYDLMLTRYVLLPNENLMLPEHNGTGLLMVMSGEIEVDAEGELSALAAEDGQMIAGDASVTNASSTAAVFVYVYLGDEVADSSAGAPQAAPGTSTTEEGDSTTATAPQAETATEPASDTQVESGTAEEGTLQEEADPAEGAETVPTTNEAGEFLTSINVTADQEIYLIITVDGLTVFDGYLPAGQASGPVVGTTFEVYTSSGVSTNFTNACGETFKMGYEEGEATYVLSADANSCAP